MTARKEWTNHEVERLKELRATGLSEAEIAGHLNRSKSATNTKCRDLMYAGLIPRRTPVEKHRIMQRRATTRAAR